MRINERWAPGELLQSSEKPSGAVSYDVFLDPVDISAGNSDTPAEDDDHSKGPLARRGERLAFGKGMKLANAPQALDFLRLQNRENLVPACLER